MEEFIGAYWESLHCHQQSVKGDSVESSERKEDGCLSSKEYLSDHKQNVGINLGEYMSKDDTFKLTIEDTEYIEYGRNDIFVIFNINSKNIKTTSGKYIITNETDDFISDGNWSIS